MEAEDRKGYFSSPTNTGGVDHVGSGDFGPPVGSSTPNIVIKTEEDYGGERSRRQGFIEVSTSANGKQNVTLKSNASVSRRSHTPELATSGKSSPGLDMLNLQSLKNTQNLQQMLRSGNQVFHINVQPPSIDGRSTPPKAVQQMIIVKPDEDAEEIMSKTVNEITSTLNEQAAARLAQGYTPDKETVIEITRIATPCDSYFSRENTKTVGKSSEGVPPKKDSQLGHDKLENQGRSLHPRKTPLLKRSDTGSSLYFSKPGKPAVEVKPFEEQPADISTSSNAVLVSSQSHFRPVNTVNYHSDTSTVSHVPVQTVGAVQTNLPATASMVVPVQTSSLSQNSRIGKRSVTILSRGKVDGQNTYVIQTSQSGATSTTSNNSSMVFVPSEDSQPDSLGLSMDEDFGNDSRDGSIMNDSLTNIHWLGHMKGDNLQVVNHKDMRLIASEKQIEKVNSECGKHKRPPYSYMHLIQMAICSKPDKKMTLKDIYSWIEIKFPYYKSNPNKGWRNSIRHNLSLYDIFVREKVNIPGKSMVSFWTLRSDIKPRIAPNESEANLDDSLLVKTDPIEPASPVFFIQNELPQKTLPEIQPCVNSNRKRPVPLLPKPSLDTPQTYALIPIQGGVPVVPSQPIMVPANWTNQYSNADVTDYSEVKSSLKRSVSPDVSYPSKRKQIKIAPKMDPSSLTDQHRVWPSNSSSNNSVYSLDTSDMHSQLSHIKFFDSGFASLSENSSSTQADISGPDGNATGLFSVQRENSLEAWTNGSHSVGQCLPKPDGKSGNPSLAAVKLETTTTTTVGRRGKRKRKSPHSSLLSSPSAGNIVNLSDSHLGDAGISDILASIEKDLSSPARQLLKTPTKADSLFTSTPFKDRLVSPSWISPIRGFLMNEEGDLHPSLFTPPDKSKGKKTSTPLEKQTTPKAAKHSAAPRTPNLEENNVNIFYRESLGSSPGIGMKLPVQRSPKLGSLRGLGLVGLTPLKSPNGRRLVIGGHVHSPGVIEDNSGEETASFGRLLGDMQLDSMIEDGMQDMANISFSQLGL